MPPKSDKLPAAEIELIRQWIAAGLPENRGSKTREAAALQFQPLAKGIPDTPVMPEKLPAFAEARTAHPHPVTALAASSLLPMASAAMADPVMALEANASASIAPVAIAAASMAPAANFAAVMAPVAIAPASMALSAMAEAVIEFAARPLTVVTA